MESLERHAPLEVLTKLTQAILDPSIPAYTLREEVLALTGILESVGDSAVCHATDLAYGETNTGQGKAISPAAARLCADDYVRTVQFLRGVNQAIVDLLAVRQTVNVVYAGCGPLALLAVPLMTQFKQDQAQFTLLDIHTASIDSVMKILASFNFNDHVHRCEVTDALNFHIDKKYMPDVFVIELMQACLEVEPQVAVMRHFFSQAPEATFIPQKVGVFLRRVDINQEFATHSENERTVAKNRTCLGDIFVLDKTAMRNWQSLSGDTLPGNTIILEHEPDVAQTLETMLFTQITVYGEFQLDWYDSGLTSPRVFSVPINNATQVSCSYRLGSRPGLEFDVV